MTVYTYIYVICIDMSISPSKNTIKYIYISIYIIICNYIYIIAIYSYLSRLRRGFPTNLALQWPALGMTVVAAVSLALGRRGPWRYV